MGACSGSSNAQAGPYGPSDSGTSNHDSSDQGMSAGTGTGTALDQRRAARIGMAFEMLSAGTPLMQGGDAYLRTPQCNNAYNLESNANWLSNTLSTNQTNVYTFAQRLIVFRKAHLSLQPASWHTASQLSWYQPSGSAPESNYWSNASNHSIAYAINGPSFGDANSIYVAYNGWSGSVASPCPLHPPTPAGIASPIPATGTTAAIPSPRLATKA